MTEEYTFDVGRNRVFAELEGSIAAAGTLGIQVLDAGGNETLRDFFRMTTPAINAKKDKAVVFDIGGTTIRMLSNSRLITSMETTGEIVSATINEKGWIVVCNQERGTSLDIVTVYSEIGNAEYIVRMATGYVLSAQLSPDNRSLAILNMTEYGSRISYYNLNSETIDRAFDYPSEIILDIRFLISGEVLAISTQSLFIIGRNNESEKIYEFAGRQLGGYALNDNYVTLYLLDYSVGYSGQLITIGEDRNILGEVSFDREVISISTSDTYLSVLRSDKLIFFNTALEEIPGDEDPGLITGATIVLALNSGKALLAGDHFATIVSGDS